VVTDNSQTLIGKLRSAGISRAAIDAAWPSWWTEEASKSPSGRAELRFALARRLGLEAKPLLGERVEFIWNDDARFKHLTTQDENDKAILTSYGITIGRLLLKATPNPKSIEVRSAEQLREAILSSHHYVDLQSLIASCWAIGIPIVHLRVFPLEAKSMHAMAITVNGRFAIALGRDALYPAPIAFTVAHELGHILLRHLEGISALVDLEDPATTDHSDNEEQEADTFALSLLTGSPNPDIQTDVDTFNAPTLAGAVLDAGPKYLIEPGTLALCLAHRKNAWPTANAALKFIYSEQKPVWQEVNGIATKELDWDRLGDDGADFLRKVMTDK